MQWWAWIAAGAVLLGAEMSVVNAQFYLVFVGASAFVVGALMRAGLVRADWLQWLIFLLLAVLTMTTFRKRIYERMRRNLPPLKGGPPGETILVPAGLAPGETCRVEFRGSSWSAVNGGRAAIAAGSKARIVRVEGLTLVVHGEE
jgi:membrane protein implicated in regulation of membrane protease activity